MSAYLMANIIEIRDMDLYRKYVELAGPVIASHGGKQVGNRPEPTALEGSWSGQRVLLFEFPSMEALDKWYTSDEYAPLIEMRKTAADITLVKIDGVS